MGTKDARPERTQTDESLAGERAKADHALSEKKVETEKKADVVLERAREEADDVLTAARAKADEKLKSPASPTQTKSALAKERSTEDDVLRDERAKADQLIRRERAASLARLFPLERDETDLYLLTERARSDEALANRDDFLGMVSHDLRDLLNGIVVNAALIEEDAVKGGQGTTSNLSAAQRIQRSAGRMVRLIGDLVDIASIDAGKLAVLPAETGISALIAEAIEAFAAPALAKGVVLESFGHPPMRAKLDNARILQVLGNLITNAVKFSARGARIVIQAEEVEGEIRFSVKDSGVGIPNDKLEAIFVRFWQIGKRDHRGLGLGLYISKCLVEAHGGRIWAESQIGVGSTFFFTVPAALEALT